MTVFFFPAESCGNAKRAAVRTPGCSGCLKGSAASPTSGIAGKCGAAFSNTEATATVGKDVGQNREILSHSPWQTGAFNFLFSRYFLALSD
jgi:hypothetical protein